MFKMYAFDRHTNPYHVVIYSLRLPDQFNADDGDVEIISWLRVPNAPGDWTA
jgi:hypothetical protein